MNRRHAVATLALLANLGIALPARALQAPPDDPPQAQGGQLPGPPQGAPPLRGPGQGGRGPRPAGRDGRPDNPSADMRMPPGRWWNNPNIAQSVGLTAAQIQKMDGTFNGVRDHLIDLDAAVRKAEAGLQPLLDSDQIDRAKITAQIDQLTQAKSELERATAEMLLDIRAQLTHDQWVKLAALRPPER